jgi:phage terminase large subunit-like protein
MTSSTSERPTILQPLSGPAPLGDRPTEGWQVIAWIESHCTYGEGDWAGEPVRLARFQKWLLLHLYELRADGSRRYKRALLEFPKGNGKTPLNAWVGLYELWHRRSPVIPVGATAFEQAALLFGDMRACVESSDVLQTRLEAFEDKIVLKDGTGYAGKVAAKGGTNDGKRPSSYCADEIHEMVTAEQKKAYRVIERGIVKRSSGFVFNTTTPGSDLDGLLGKMHLQGIKTNDGEPGGDPRFLFVWYGAGPEWEHLDDPVVLAGALRAANPAADLFLDVDEHVAMFGRMPRFEYERYHLGRWTQVLAAWLPPGAWDGRLDHDAAKLRTATSPGIRPGSDVVLGFDGSWNGDSTALVACTLNGHVLGVVGAWEKPEDARPDWRVPPTEVEAAIRQAFRDYRVRELVYDRRIWHQLFEELEAEGFPVVEMPQGMDMLDAAGRFYAAVADGALHHDGDPRLTRHVGNCVGVSTANGVRVQKESKDSTRWIDLAIAAVMAYDSAAAIAPPEPGPQVFDPSELDLDSDADWLDDL